MKMTDSQIILYVTLGRDLSPNICTEPPEGDYGMAIKREGEELFIQFWGRNDGDITWSTRRPLREMDFFLHPRTVDEINSLLRGRMRERRGVRLTELLSQRGGA